jgi:hypothetical protein
MTTPETQTEAISRSRAILAATTLAASLAMGGCAITAETPTNAPTTGRETSNTPYTPELTMCTPVDDDSVQATTALLDRPHGFAATIKQVPHQDTAIAELSAKRRVAAERYGLTIYDYRTEYRDLFKDVNRAQTKPIAEYLQRTTEFAARYGVTLSVPATTESNSDPATTPLDMSHLTAKQQQQVRYALTGFIDNLGEMPVEFVQSTGLKHIYLVHIPDELIAGFADQATGDAFYVDPLKRLDAQTFAHELTHLWDANVCGGPEGSFLDPGFDRLNPVNVYGEYLYEHRVTERGDYTDHESVAGSKQASELLKKMQADYLSSDKTLADHDWRKFHHLFRHVVSTSSYGMVNIAEDKATIGEEIFEPYDYQGVYDKNQPILAAKFAYLLARIYQANPSIAKYLIEVGNNKF